MDDSGKLIAVIGDEDTVTGFVLAGVGQKSVEGCNFLVVTSGRFLPPAYPPHSSLLLTRALTTNPLPPLLPYSLLSPADTPLAVVESSFRALTSRSDVGILLINQHVANTIRHVSACARRG